MSTFKKLAAVALAGLMVISFMPVSASKAATVDELQAQITALLAQISALQAQLNTTSGTTTTSTACFTKTLSKGMTDDQVKSLQEKLATDSSVYPEGLTTGYFGSLTESAVQKFQAKYSLVSSGTPETTGYGLVGPKTRAQLNSLYCTTTTGTTTTGTTTTTTTGTTTTTTTTTGTGLTVALASDTATASTVIADSTNGGQALIPFAKYNFTAGSSDVKVTQLKGVRFGVSNNNDTLNWYIYDGETRLAEMQSVSTDNIITFSNSAGLFTVPAGTTKAITVKGDIAKGTSAGKTIAFGINSADQITTDGATVSGTFPANGNYMTVATVSDLGKITFTHSTYPTAVDPVVDVSRELWRLTSTVQNQKVELRKLSFTAIGTFSVGDITDLTLTIGSSTYGPIQMSSDKTVAFDLSANPFLYEAGQTKSISLSGKVIGGANRTVYFALQNASDIVAFDKNYGVFIPHNGSDTFTVINYGSGNSTTINAGSLTVTRSTESPSGDVVIAGTNVEIARFNFAAAGEKIKVTSLTGYLTCTTATSTIKNVKLYVDGSQVGTTDTSVVCSGSEAIGGLSSLGNSFMVESGHTAVITIKGDLTQTAGSPAAGDTVYASLAQGTNNYQKMVSGDYGNTAAVTGNSLTFRAGTVSAAKNLSVPDGTSNDPSVISGAVSQRIGSYAVTGGLGEAVDLTQFVIKDTAGTFPTSYTNLKFINNATGVQIGSTYGTLTATANTTYSFVPTSSIRLGAGQQMVFDVYADIKTGLSAGNSATTTLSAVYATGVDTSQSADYTTAVTGQTIYVAQKGSLTITVDSNTPIAQQIVSGKSYEFARFQLAAGTSESVRLTNITVSDVAGAAADVIDLTNFYLYDVTSGKTLVAGPVYTVNTSSATPSTAGYVVFNGLSYVVPKGQNKVLSIEAKVNGWYTGQSANTHIVKLLPDYLTTASTQSSVTAYGVESNTALTQGSGLTFDHATGTDNVDPLAGNTMTVYRTKPITITTGSFTATNGASALHEIGHFVVTNDSNAGSYDATVSSMKITLNGTNLAEGTAHATGTRTVTLYKDSITTANKVAELVLQYSSGTTATFSGDLDFSTTSNSALSSGFSGYTVVTASSTVFTSAGVKVSSGQSKTFILVVDSTVPKTTAAASAYLSATLGSTGLTWSDGSATSITSVDPLPMIIGSYNSATW